MSQSLEFTILGSGSSGGVPRADGNWGDCNPEDSRNLRTRCSLLVRRRGDPTGPVAETTVVVDTSPDFRLQSVRAGIRRIDAALFTHDHADQSHGIDDMRAFFLNQRRRIPTYMDPVTRAGLTSRFAYIFEDHGGYPAICEAHNLPDHGQSWTIEGSGGAIPVLSFDLDHGGGRSVGFRFGDVAYTPDVVGIPEESWPALMDLDVWIVDALRWIPHPTHAHVDLALEWIARAKPRRAILTNLHIDLDYEALSARLPANVVPAFDNLRFTA